MKTMQKENKTTEREQIDVVLAEKEADRYHLLKEKNYRHSQIQEAAFNFMDRFKDDFDEFHIVVTERGLFVAFNHEWMTKAVFELRDGEDVVRTRLREKAPSRSFSKTDTFVEELYWRGIAKAERKWVFGDGLGIYVMKLKQFRHGLWCGSMALLDEMDALMKSRCKRVGITEEEAGRMNAYDKERNGIGMLDTIVGFRERLLHFDPLAVENIEQIIKEEEESNPQRADFHRIAIRK